MEDAHQIHTVEDAQQIHTVEDAHQIHTVEDTIFMDLWMHNKRRIY